MSQNFTSHSHRDLRPTKSRTPLHKTKTLPNKPVAEQALVGDELGRMVPGGIRWDITVFHIPDLGARSRSTVQLSDLALDPAGGFSRAL